MIGLILTLAGMLVQSAASPAARGTMVGVLIEVGLVVAALFVRQILVWLNKVEPTSGCMGLCWAWKRSDQ